MRAYWRAFIAGFVIGWKEGWRAIGFLFRGNIKAAWRELTGP